MLRELTEPFARVTAAEASALVEAQWGIAATALDRLDTERDDSFRVRGEVDHLLKIAHPLDGATYVRLQTEAMARAGRAGLPVQSVLGTATVDGRIARLLTWLPGALMRETPYGLDAVTATGASLARVAQTLAGFEHPGAHRTFAWDLQSFGALRRLEHPAALDAVFERFAALDLAALPHQVIHNDFHPGNLLVDADDPAWITGILDFGDTVHAPRVQDLAVALAYLLPDDGDPIPTIAAFVEGYAGVTQLLPAELEALPVLIAARLGQRIILPPLLEPGLTPAPSLLRTLERL
ncbi:phosphotransferase [soil metagenome]